MMGWQPKYTITDRLMVRIREIGEAIGEIRTLTSLLSQEDRNLLQLHARELSTHASTSIEGNPLGLTDVKRLLKSSPYHLRDTEREVLNYNTALRVLYADVKSGTFQATLPVLTRLQDHVVQGLMENPCDVGHIRNRPVVIRDPRDPNAIVFIPPDAKDVPKLIDELLEFVRTHMDRMDPILLAGLFHRQSVIIHPFMDGNGRTTRLFTTAILGAGGLDLFDVLSFENYYNRNISKYFREVGAYGDYYEEVEHIDFTSWLMYFSDGILDELVRVRAEIREHKPSPATPAK